jgi:large subunit ribosomal protein L24e
MVRIEHCSFCGSPVWPGHGTMYVRNDCKCFRFCRKKCRKFWMRKKNPRKLKWTKPSRAAHGKDLVVDRTFDFEQRRNWPVKYDRGLVDATVRTIQIVDQIRQDREAAHWERRMRTAAAIETRMRLLDIAQNVNLIEPNPELARIQVQHAEAEIEQQKAAIYEQLQERRRAAQEEKPE